jgi:hypothetical protein
MRSSENGDLWCVWLDLREKGTKLFASKSIDDGATFGNAVRLGNSAWMLNACPMDGGMLAIDKDQHIATTWHRDRSIHQAMTSPGTDIPVDVGEQPWIASGADGFYTVWTSKRDGEMLLMKLETTEPKRLAVIASFPVIFSNNGKSSAATPLSSTVNAFWKQRSNQRITPVGQRLE